MQLDDDLQAIKQGINGCSLVAFGDLRTRLTLSAVSDRRRSQESLDQICAQASRAFKAVDALSKVPTFDDRNRNTAMMKMSEELFVFVRSHENEFDALFCVCDDASAEQQVSSLARGVFDKLAPVN